MTKVHLYYAGLAARADGRLLLATGTTVSPEPTRRLRPETQATTYSPPLVRRGPTALR